MNKSKAVAYEKLLTLSSISLMCGNGYGLRLIHLFSLLKSVTNRILPSFFGMMNVGAAHSQRLTFVRTPKATNQSKFMLNSSSRNVSKAAFQRIEIFLGSKKI